MKSRDNIYKKTDINLIRKKESESITKDVKSQFMRNKPFNQVLRMDSMSEKETCPKCKTGKLRPEEGDIGSIDLVCDNASCHHTVSG